MQWTGGDPNGDALTYDVYLGTSNPPSLAQSALTTPYYDPGTLNANSTYYWYVISSDGIASDTSATFTFSTASTHVLNSFTKHTINTGISSLNELSPADFNKDGYVDFIVGAQGNYLYYYQNNGNGTFTANEISLSYSATSVEVCDLDKDGDLDFVATETTTDSAHWFENNGLESFTRHVISGDTISDVEDARVADFDGDGDLDIAFASHGEDSVKIYENDGSQNFSRSSAQLPIAGPPAVDSGDLDGDGDIDIVAGGYAGGGNDELAWFENTGNENYTKHSIHSNLDGVRDVQVIDVDNDGLLDILYVVQNGATTGWYENTGSATFTNHVISTLSNPQFIKGTDLDGDGDVDIVASFDTFTPVAWFENDGSQNFTQRSVTSGGMSTGELAFGDVDADGLLDVFLLYQTNNEIDWYEAISNQAPNTPSLVYPASGTGIPVDTTFSWTASDPNGDPLTYNILFGTTDTPPLVRTGNTSNSYYPGVLVGGTTYYWTVVAVDPYGATSSPSSQGSFTTESFPTRSFEDSLVIGLAGSEGYDVARAAEGGYIAAGSSSTHDLVRLSYEGDTLWTAKYNNGSNNYGYSVVATGDKGFVTTGIYYGGSDWDVLLAKADQNGDPVWSKTYSQSTNLGNPYVIRTENGGFLFAAWVNTTDYDAYVVKTDSGGNQTWAIRLGQAGVDEYPNDVIEAPDGGYILATASGLIKVSTDGDSLWKSSGGISFVLNGVVATPDGGYLAVGNGGKIQKYNSSGVAQWNKSYGTYSNDNFTDVAIMLDGSYIISGDMSHTSGGPTDAWLVKTDTAGDTLWTRTFGSSDYDNGRAVDIASDGGIIVAGRYWSVSNQQYYFIKTDANGIVHSPPDTPSIVQPTNGGTGVNPNVTLAWSATDPDNDPITYTVKLNTFSPPVTVVLTGSSDTSLVQSLDYNGTYYWQVIATDSYGGVTTGPVWSFQTETDNAPTTPFAIAPRDGETSVSRTRDLEWISGDADGDPLSFIVYLGTSPSPGAIDTVTARLYNTGVLAANTTYYWKIVADDGKLSPVTSAVYSFSTEDTYDVKSFTKHTIDNAISGIYDIQAGDLDGDGDIDIAGCSKTGNTLDWWQNNGSQNFTKHTIVTSFLAPTDLKLTDLDQDGDLDVVAVASDYNQNYVYWFKNNGSGSFTPYQIAIHYYYPTSFDVGDIDLDGDLDIAVGTTSSGYDSLAWYENDGSQSFTRHNIYAGASSGINNLYLADMDGDDDIDLLINSAYGYVSYWANDGSQNFTQTQIAAFGPMYVHTVDVNNDGDMDFLSAENSIQYYENNGSGSFSFFSSTGAVSARFLVSGDMEGDGDVDLLVGNSNGNNVKWLRNEGNYFYTTSVTSSYYGGAAGVDLVDMDGDGDLDVIAAAPDDGELAWFETLPSLPPDAPVVVSPGNGASSVSSGSALTWSCSDPNAQSLAYDVYFGTSPTPPLVVQSQSDTTFYREALIGDTTYYWKVVAWDPDSNSTSSSTWSFTTASVPVAQWRRTAGSSMTTYWEMAHSVAVTNDGGYVVYGYNHSYQAWLVKYDADGEKVWDKTYVDSYYSTDYHVEPLSDGGFLLATGYQANDTDDFDVHITRIDADGNVSWTKTIGSAFNDEYAHGAAETADGGFIICGQSAPTGTTYEEDGYLIRTNSSGDTIWTATYGGTNQQILNAVKAAPDGGFIAAGSYMLSNPGLNSEFWLLKVDENGGQVFSTTDGGTGNDYGMDLDIRSDGTILVAGYANSTVIGSQGGYDAWLEEFNSDGSFGWQSIFGTSDDEYFFGIDGTIDGGCILAGYQYISSTSTHVSYLAKTNSSGTQEWLQTHQTRDNDVVYDVQQAPDRGFVLAGKTQWNGEQPDYLTIKTDVDGTVNEPPYAASNPTPADGATGQSPRLTVSWTGGDPDGDPVTYDLLLDTSPTPTTTVASGLDTATFTPSGLSYSTTYYWQVISYDDHGHSTSSNVGSFTTKADTPPAAPWLAWDAPQDTAENVSRVADLSWHSYDADNDPLTFDVYFGATSSPYLVNSGQSAMRYNPGVLNPATTYYWKIVADDNYGNTANSPLWSFTTASEVLYTVTTTQSDFTSPNYGPYQMDVADIDLDGDLDLLGLGTSLVTDYMRNNGNDTFTPIQIKNKYQASCMKAVDFDFDGDVDVLAGVFSDSSFAVYENDGSQSFTYHEVEGSTYGVIGVDAADMDNDGDLDVVGIGRNSATVAWFENNGGWSFTKHIVDGSFTWVEKVYAVDLNNDGNVDIVATMNLAGADQVNAYMNNGDLTFTKQIIVSSGSGIEDIDFADLNNDGYLDFVAAEQSNNAVSWYENQEGTVFARHDAYSMSDVSAVKAADLDADGDYDIVVGTQTSGTVVWLKNDGSGNFSNPATLSTSFSYASDIHAADLNGDGVLDVVASAGVSTSLPMAWWKRIQNNPPTTPVALGPVNGQQNVHADTTLSWSSSDPDGDAVTYTLYFDTNAFSMAVVSDHSSSSTYDPGTLTLGETYFWRVIAYDTKGDSTIGSLWQFTVTTNEAPETPLVDSPFDAATDVEITPTLSWSCNDPNPGDIVSFDLYLGTSAGSMTQVASGQTAASYTPSALEYNTTYYWKVVATDTSNYVTEGPVWSFTTVANQPPTAPESPYPDDYASDLAVDTQLSWVASTDNENETVLYDVYFDTVNPPLQQVVSGGDTTTFDPGALSYGQTYYWYVIAKDSYGNSSAGSTWTFTAVQNYAPTEPEFPDPTDGATDIAITPLLSWTASTDTENETISYKVLFDTVNPPVTQVADGDTTSFNPDTLTYSTQYFWQVIATDSYGNSTPGLVWNFVTVDNQAPTEPSLPSPGDFDSGIAINAQLSWEPSTDQEGESIGYKVYFDTVNPPATQVADGDTADYDPGILAYNTQYYWKVIAYDTYGNTTESLVWRFLTVSNEAPTTPDNPTPGTDSYDVAIDQILSWTPSTDTEGDTISYDVFFDTVNPPLQQVVYSGDSTTFDPGVLEYNQTYYWYVIAKDSYGNPSTGSTWFFATIQNYAPSDPSSPNPVDAATDVDVDVQLSWSACTDPEGETVMYKVFLDTLSPPVQQVMDGDSTHFNPGRFKYERQYFWKVIAYDTYGNTTEGSEWTFVTASNQAPTVPANPQPADLAVDVSLDTLLSWSASTDADGDTVMYDVFFGTEDPPTVKVVNDGDSTSWKAPVLAYNMTYYWQVIAEDSYGNQTTGSVWSFATLNSLPSPPSNPSPFAGETGGAAQNAVLRWTSGDRDGDPITFDVYFGTSDTPPLVSTEQDSFYYTPDAVSENSLYYWKVVAHDTHGGQSSSPLWRFRTPKPLEHPFFTMHLVEDQTEDAAGVATADLDLDGDQDIVSVTRSTATVSGMLHWWENLGTDWGGHFIDVESGLYQNVNVSTADVDADGDIDIVANQNVEVQYWENVSSGSGWTLHNIASSAGDRAVAVDLDNDGALEFLDSQSHWWDWNGVAWAESTYTQEVNEGLHWGDLDNDGDLDIVGSLSASNEIAWWENSGDASSWTKRGVASSFAGVKAVYTADMDGDNDLDIVAASGSSGEIAWWENSGNGAGWIKHAIVTGYDTVNDLKASDFDFDGDMDLLAGTGNEGVLLIENTGAVWTVQDVEDLSDSTGFANTNRLSITDIDGDGDLDIVAQNESGRQIAWFESQSNSFPTAPEVLSPSDGGEDIAVDATLAWGSTDANGDTLRYDLFFDTADPPVARALSGDTSSTYDPGELAYGTTYYWIVIVDDRHGGVVAGDVWSFTTVANQPPSEPVNPSPGDLAEDVPVDVQLVWDASTDEEGQAITYRVYFGTDQQPLPLVSEQSDTAYSPAGLVTNTVYSWRVVAVDALGDSTAGSRWSFTTLNTPPSPFAMLSPAAEDTNHTGQIDLSWERSFDPDDGSSIEYVVTWSLDENFGTVSAATASDTFFTITGLEDIETTSGRNIRILPEPNLRTSNGIRAVRSKFMPFDDPGEPRAVAESYRSANAATTTPLPDDSYLHIRVSAKDDHDAVTWADDDSSGVRVWLEFFDPPEAFSLMSPEMDATCFSLDTTLTWQTAVDPDPGDSAAYTVYLGNLPDLSDARQVAVDLQDTSLLLQDLEPFSEFYWTVHAQDHNTAGTWASDTLHFSTHTWRTTLTVALRGQKFEWISFCFLASDKSVSNLFSDLTAQFVMLRDDAGKVTIPNKGIDQIGQIDPAKGYQAFLSADANLIMNGLALHPATSYTVRSGRWNLLVNPLIDTTAVETAFRELTDHLIAVQNDAGGIWAPGETVKTLNDVIPGEAYQILVDQTMTFVYGTGSPSTTATASSGKNPVKSITVAAAESSPPATGLPYNVFVTLDPDISRRNARVIELLEGDNVVGASVLPEQGELTLVTAWKGVPEFNLAGFTSGSTVTVRLKDADGKVIPARIKGSGARYGEGGYGHIEIKLVPLPERFEVGKPYPNPFNPTATILVALPEAARVRVEVYNILGQRVDVLRDGVMAAGYNRVLMDGSRWASGLYFVRVSVAGHNDELRKMILIR